MMGVASWILPKNIKNLWFFDKSGTLIDFWGVLEPLFVQLDQLGANLEPMDLLNRSS